MKSYFIESLLAFFQSCELFSQLSDLIIIFNLLDHILLSTLEYNQSSYLIKQSINISLFQIEYGTMPELLILRR